MVFVNGQDALLADAAKHLTVSPEERGEIGSNVSKLLFDKCSVASIIKDILEEVLKSK